MKIFKHSLILTLTLFLYTSCLSQIKIIDVEAIPFDIYPLVIDAKPNLPSPFKTNDSEEYVVAITKIKKYAVISVTLSNNRGICQQLIVDTSDFPELAETGLHSEKSLNEIKTITGRSLAEITKLGRPNGLSYSGFLAEDENIISVLIGDNQIVRKLGLTHPQLAKPLFHVLNMMDTDLALNRWNMAKHQWENICCFYYNDNKVFVKAVDTKGGQQSIFDEGIEGAFHIKLWHEFDAEEIKYLNEHYGHLSSKEFDDFKIKLSFINTGEMQPQYIMRYGFYEGHTFWRADPIAVSFIFGFKSLEELDLIFRGKLYEALIEHFTESNK